MEVSLILRSSRAIVKSPQTCFNCRRPLLFSRHQTTYQRTRRRLNVKPDPAFLPSKTETHDHIIYNPPPSAPNVYHTPNIFLPKTDRRYQTAPPVAVTPNNSSATPSGTTKVPKPQSEAPPLRPPRKKRYHLTMDDMNEMRQLRREDPMKWSSNQLAKKFDCSPIFVGFVTEGIAREKKELQKKVTEAVKASWGVKRRVAREDRKIRKERWGRDE